LPSPSPKKEESKRSRGGRGASRMFRALALTQNLDNENKENEDKEQSPPKAVKRLTFGSPGPGKEL